MYHIIFRTFLAIVWMVVAIVCGVKGNGQMAAVYGAIGIAFLYSAISMKKKRE